MSILRGLFMTPTINSIEANVRPIAGTVPAKPASRPYENERSNPVSSPLQLPCMGLFHTLKHPHFPNFA